MQVPVMADAGVNTCIMLMHERANFRCAVVLKYGPKPKGIGRSCCCDSAVVGIAIIVVVLLISHRVSITRKGNSVTIRQVSSLAPHLVCCAA